jgi:hypothetical protein
MGRPESTGWTIDDLISELLPCQESYWLSLASEYGPLFSYILVFSK